MHSKTILLVEDDPSDVDLTRRAFEKSSLGNTLAVVHDGLEALDYLFSAYDSAGREPAQLPTVILLDLNLPKVDGLEVLRRIRADSRTRRLPVVILTSSTEQQDLVKGYELGANSYIRKPIDFYQFAEKIRQMELYWLVLNEPPPPVR